eukprot:10385548-Lingulodinium_polyedra.AAC.1
MRLRSRMRSPERPAVTASAPEAPEGAALCRGRRNMIVMIACLLACLLACSIDQSIDICRN